MSTEPEPQIAKILSIKVTRFKPEEITARQESAVLVFQGMNLPADLEQASLFVKMRRLRGELTTWAKEGMPLVTKEVRKSRVAICKICEYYNPKGNLGMGQCQAPGCGCTRVKAALATSKCPKDKWPAYPAKV